MRVGKTPAEVRSQETLPASQADRCQIWLEARMTSEDVSQSMDRLQLQVWRRLFDAGLQDRLPSTTSGNSQPRYSRALLAMAFEAPATSVLWPPEDKRHIANIQPSMLCVIHQPA